LAAKERHDRRVHFDRPLALLDPLLRRVALIVKGDDALRRSRQIGEDEADTRVKFVRMPLNLGHDTPWLPPALRLITEADEASPAGASESESLKSSIAALSCVGGPVAYDKAHPAKN
jgi:hypothetical protein